MRLLLGLRAVLDAARDDEELTRLEHDVAVAELDRKPSGEHEEKVVGLRMRVPHELALDLTSRSTSKRLVELRNPGRGSGRYNLFTPEWAERWPAEEMWKARKVA